MRTNSGQVVNLIAVRGKGRAEGFLGDLVTSFRSCLQQVLRGPHLPSDHLSLGKPQVCTPGQGS